MASMKIKLLLLGVLISAFIFILVVLNVGISDCDVCSFSVFEFMENYSSTCLQP